MQNFQLRNINNKKNLYFEEKISETKNNPKELWRTLPPNKRLQFKILLKENGVVSINSRKNENNFCRFFSNLVNSFLKNFHVQKTNLKCSFEMCLRILFYTIKK